MFVFLLGLVACGTGGTPEDTAGDTAGDTSSDSGGLADVAVGHAACGPDDSRVTEFLVGTDTCDGPPTQPFPRFVPLAATLTAGAHFSTADTNLLAWWQTTATEGEPAASAELDVVSATGTVEFTWTLVAGGVEHAGRAVAEVCSGDEPQCG